MQEFTAREYLKIDIANNFSEINEKANWDIRIKWFDNNEHHLESLIHQAEEPALFFAGVQAWRDVQAGKPIGYPISMDACSSGLQLLTCLTQDRSAATLCGVINTGHREDAYANIYQYMAETGAQQKQVKKAVMTLN